MREDGPPQPTLHGGVWLTQIEYHPPDNHAYIMTWWVWPHKHVILAISVHFFGKILSPSIIIIPDLKFLGGKNAGTASLK